jgi:hypothetical protein
MNKYIALLQTVETQSALNVGVTVTPIQDAEIKMHKAWIAKCVFMSINDRLQTHTRDAPCIE